MGDLARVALLDGRVVDTVGELPVDRRRGERDVERDVVVPRGESLQVGADLVGHVAGAGDPVASGDDDVDEAVLHEVTAGVVDDHGVGDTVLTQLPGGEACALVPGPGLVDPDVHGDAGVMGGVDGCRRRAVVDEREPSRVAVGQHVDRGPGSLVDRLEQGQTVLADASAPLGVVVGDRLGFVPRSVDEPVGRGHVLEGIELAPDGPRQVHRGGPAGDELGGSLGQPSCSLVRRVPGCLGGGEGHAVAGGRADQSRPPDGHVGDRGGHLRRRGDVDDRELERELALVDRLHHLGSIRITPDGALRAAVHVHGLSVAAAVIADNSARLPSTHSCGPVPLVRSRHVHEPRVAEMSEEPETPMPWSAPEPGRLMGRGHMAGDFLEAYDWTVLEERVGFLRLDAGLPDHVKNPRGQLFGGFTPTYVDLVALNTVRAGPDQAARAGSASGWPPRRCGSTTSSRSPARAS